MSSCSSAGRPLRGLLLGAALCAAALAHSDEAADRVRMLFSTQFAFTREGLPIVTVRLMERQNEIVLSGDGMRILPLGEGGPEVRASGDFRVTLEGGQPAKLRYLTVVERFPISAKADAQAALEKWRGRGLSPQLSEIGAVFGVAGEVLDRRALLVCVSPKTTAAEAERTGEELRRRFHAETSVHSELAERPHGTVVARGPGANPVEVRADGALWFAPAQAGGKLLARAVEFGVGYPNHGREDRSYWGKLYVTVDRYGQLALVNAVPEDKLLAGLVPAEMYPSAPEEALKAQAVAARAELLAKIGARHLGDPYLLCASQHCQVYSGAGKEHPRTTAAIAATRGQVLFREGIGDLVDTVYSASCGGFTESNENVWDDMPADPALRGRPDVAGADAAAFARFGGAISDANVRDFLAVTPPAFCNRPGAAAKNFRWTVHRSARELLQGVASLGVGGVRGLTVLERGISGRARALRVDGERSSKEVRGELRIRQLLGGLPSSLFVVEPARGGDGFDFHGGGFGHGVGLCQNGAIGMAEAGHNYKDILRHYYRGAKLRNLY
jgi:SpoIID/LytB domain protein